LRRGWSANTRRNKGISMTFKEALREEGALCEMCDEMMEWLAEIPTPGATLATAGNAILLPLCTTHADPIQRDITDENRSEIAQYSRTLKERARDVQDKWHVGHVKP